MGRRRWKRTHTAVRRTIDRYIFKQKILRPKYCHRPELTLSEVETFEDGVCGVEDDEVDRPARKVRYAFRKIVPIQVVDNIVDIGIGVGQMLRRCSKASRRA